MKIHQVLEAAKAFLYPASVNGKNHEYICFACEEALSESGGLGLNGALLHDVECYIVDAIRAEDSDSTTVGNLCFTRIGGATPNFSQATTLYKEACTDCGGSGKWRGGTNTLGQRQCFKCGGKGYHEHKTSPQYRANERAKSANRKAAKHEEQLQLWASSHLEEHAWIEREAPKGHTFANAMKEALRRFGSLTKGQTEAIQRIIAAQQVGRQEAAQREATAQEVNVEPMVRAFNALLAAGLKAPKLRFNGLRFSPARAHPGVYYVVSASRFDAEGKGAYLGKIDTVSRFATARFVRSRECTREDEEAILRTCADPLGSARAYGQFTGHCCVCGKLLTNEGSVEAGIGPICAGRAGWGG